MIFKNAMSFKAKIKQISRDRGITAQQVQQNYLIEAFLSKLAESDYRNSFIIKGGYLIGGMVGLDLRATRDLDTTIKGFELTPGNLERIAKDIVEIPTEESFTFKYEGVEEIREADDYPGYRVKLIATFEQIEEIVTIDVTTGDIITPTEVGFHFNKMFSDGKLELLTYPIETVLAEKLETILSRGIGTTRPRDFYDVFILSKLKADEIDYGVLAQALKNTKEKRKSVFELAEYESIISAINNSEFQRKLWGKYQKEYSYAKDTSFDTVLKEVLNMMHRVAKQL